MDYEKLLHQVTELVRQAGESITAVDFTVESKGDVANIVTSSDVKVQHFLMRALKKLLPSSGFFCEEEDCRDHDSEYVWIIDPIDGTTNYARGIGDCCVSVGLAYRKELQLGVVFNPYRNEMFTAVRGGGAICNGKPIRVSDRPFENGLFCTAMSLYNKTLAPACFDVINDVYYKSNDIRRFGSCAIELCYLAAGKCELYFEIRVFPWDYAGACLILREAGGILTGLNGEALTLDRPTVLIGANTQENYRKLRDIVGTHIPQTPYKESL